MSRKRVRKFKRTYKYVKPPYRKGSPSVSFRKLENELSTSSNENEDVAGKAVGPPYTQLPSSVPSKWQLMEAEIRSLTNRVSTLEKALEDKNNAKKTDEVADAVMIFLNKYAGIKFNTGTLGANLNVPSMKMSDKLKIMAQRGLIKTEKLEGHSAMYWIEKEVNKDG